MKKTIFLKLFFVVILGKMMFLQSYLLAQTIEIENYFVQHVRLPSKNISGAVTTYSIKLRYRDVPSGENRLIDGSFLLQGYNRVDKEGDIIIQVQPEEGIQILEKKPWSYSEDDNKGKFYHTYKVRYKTPTWKLIIKSDNIEIGSHISISKVETVEVGKGEGFSKVEELADFWENRKEEFNKDMTIRSLARNIKTFGNQTQNYSLMYAYYIQEIPTIFSKKHNYEDINEASASLKRGLEYIGSELIASPNILIRQNEKLKTESIQNAIQKWETAIAEYDPDNKKGRINKKIAAHIHMDLAYAYGWIENFAQAEIYYNKCQELIKTKKEHKKASRLKNFLDDKGRRFNANTERKEQFRQSESSLSKHKIVPDDIVLADKTKVIKSKLDIKFKDVMKVVGRSLEASLKN